MTHLLTVRDVRRARAFETDVLGGSVVMEDNPCIVRLELHEPAGGGQRSGGREAEHADER